MRPLIVKVKCPEGTERPFTLSLHAIERYRERIRPGLTFTDVRDELTNVLQYATFTIAGPEWMTTPDEMVDEDADGYVILTEDILFPVARNILVTCLAKGGISDASRAYRAERRNKRVRSNERLRTRKLQGEERRIFVKRKNKLKLRDQMQD